MQTDNNDVALERMTEALTAYEEAVKEFSTSATEFIKHIPVLTQARHAYQRATAASAQLRGILDKGDETLRDVMAQMQQTFSIPLSIPLAVDADPGERTLAANVETIKAIGEKADAAQA
jgi:exonuclease VII small subunit